MKIKQFQYMYPDSGYRNSKAQNVYVYVNK